ncbi:hypothetical protein AKG95_29210 (plasmid) [Janthinobacterium lividum]|jgi:hypothetical protein|uniref:Uncharacterized protein n=1 Tax=Janthinobacterium lividum TaxID=29581 RepID=A0A1S1U2E1_9BURK|nr:hypothetical protein [Janthinobacterium lividum]MCL6485664.1 hypothetical protein [Janthinobacterium lividum]OHV93811.1 hypothetical protein AKG95_29210 [Janthinobacterium lividum]
MLDELQFDLLELIDLVRQAENYDATMAAAALAGASITVDADAAAERQRKRLCCKLREIAEKIFGPARHDWTLGTVRIADFGPCTIYIPEGRFIDIQLSPRAENDLLQTLYQLAHEVCHTLHPSRDGNSLIADITSVLNEGISTWFSCYICDQFVYGEAVRASTAQTAYGRPMDLVGAMLEIDGDSVKKLRVYQPHIDRLSPSDFHIAGVEIPDELAQSLTRSFRP